jgi:hypothetical protein
LYPTKTVLGSDVSNSDGSENIGFSTSMGPWKLSSITEDKSEACRVVGLEITT